MNAHGTEGEVAPALHARLRFAEVIAEVSRRFIDLPASRVDRAIVGALHAVVETGGFDHGFVAMFSADKASARVSHRFGEPRTASPFLAPRDVDRAELPWLFAEILSGNEVLLAGSEAVPRDASDTPAADDERALLRELAAAQSVLCPLVIAGDVIGAVGFVGASTPAQTELRVVAQIIAGALDRKRIDQQLQQRLALAELTAEVSRRFVDLPPAELGSGMEDAVQRIAGFCRFAGATLLELSEDGGTFAVACRYRAPRIDAGLPVGTELPIERYPAPLAGKLRREPAVVPLPPGSELASAPPSEREAADSSRHALIVPLAIGDEMLGSVVFEAAAEPAAELLSALAVLGELFASALKRRRAEELLQERLRFEEAMTEAATRLADTARDVADRAVEHALSAIGDALQFDRITVLELNAERSVFTARVEWRAPGIVRFPNDRPAVPIDEFGWPLTELRDGRSLAFSPEQVPSDARAARVVMQRDGTRLLVTVPLIVAGAVVGCVAFHRIRSGRALTEHQHTRLRLAGSMLASALARTSAAQSLNRSEARFAQVVTSALDAFALVNHAGVIVEWTPRAERVLGLSRSRALGADFVRTVLGDGACDLSELHAAAQQHVDGRIEVSARLDGSRELPLELSITRLSGDNEPFAVFMRDITGRKQAEQARQRAFDEVSREKRRLEGERDYLRQELRGGGAGDELVGSSEALAHVLQLVDSVASTSATVLIRGESGVGKELIARAIHARSLRASGPLVKVNCASIPAELFESEFFGHVRGAFTGAHKDRIGRFELAHRGTLLLDEVGEIPLELQAKLLRVLQENAFERVGDDRTREVDVRVIAASNRDLAQAAAEGRFRKDLYYRLSVFPIEVPPLRERIADVVPLAEHFLRLHQRALGRSGLSLDAEQKRALEAYDWPGNVRELGHVIERSVILSREPPLRLGFLSHASALPAPGPGRVLREDEVRSLERANLVQALERAGFRVAGPGGAAELLGMSPSTLRDRMKAFDIKRPGSR